MLPPIHLQKAGRQEGPAERVCSWVLEGQQSSDWVQALFLQSWHPVRPTHKVLGLRAISKIRKVAELEGQSNHGIGIRPRLPSWAMLSSPAGLWMEQLGILGKELDLQLDQLGCKLQPHTCLHRTLGWLPTCLRLNIFPGKRKQGWPPSWERTQEKQKVPKRCSVNDIPRRWALESDSSVFNLCLAPSKLCSSGQGPHFSGPQFLPL